MSLKFEIRKTLAKTASFKRQRFGFLCLLTAILLFVAFMAHSPESRPSFLFSLSMSLNDIWNKVVKVFGLVNYGEYRLLGIGVYLVPLFLFTLGVGKMRFPRRKFDKQVLAMLWILFNLSLVAAAYDLLDNDEAALTGGWLGHKVVDALYNALDKPVTILVVLLLSGFSLHRFKVLNVVRVFRQLNLKPVHWGASLGRALNSLISFFASFFQRLATPDTELDSTVVGKRSASWPGNSAARGVSEPTVVEIPELLKPKAQVSSRIYDQCQQNKRTPKDKSVPSLELLESETELRIGENSTASRDNAKAIVSKLGEFSILGDIVNYAEGPLITQYELKLRPGVKVDRLRGLTEDLALALGSESIRFEIPIRGKNTIGVEMPNSSPRTVYFNWLIKKKTFAQGKESLLVPLGLDVSGRLNCASIVKMPHLLIGGATGSGKSVFLNGALSGLLTKNTPAKMRY